MAGNIPRKKRKEPTPEKKRMALRQRFTDFDPAEITTGHAWSHFIVERRARGCEDETIKGYERFYKKLCLVLLSDENGSRRAAALEDFSNMPSFIFYRIKHSKSTVRRSCRTNNHFTAPLIFAFSKSRAIGENG